MQSNKPLDMPTAPIYETSCLRQSNANRGDVKRQSQEAAVSAAIKDIERGLETILAVLDSNPRPELVEELNALWDAIASGSRK